MSEPNAETAPIPSDSAERHGPRRCENCGAELRGEHCYRCGQPTKGLVRHFSSIIGDFADTVFNVDGRIFRTLGPLLYRPGYLSIEYFEGRRVRYVSPVRLFVFTCLFAFLVSKLSVDPNELQSVDDDDIAQASSVEEVERLREAALANLDRAIAEAGDVPGLKASLAGARVGVERNAAERIKQLAEREAGGEPAEAGKSADERPTITFNGEAWDPETNPVAIDWLPDAANARLNDWVARGLDNSQRVKDDPALLTDAFLDYLPQTLFVLVPVFALMLKLAYLFKRRLYMEHLIVALHSHAFLSLAILLVALASLARGALGSGILHVALGWFEAALFLWMPLYLLITQKRVYRQGWILTLLKFALIGTLYSILISFGLVVTVLLSLVAM
jgi:hypothetical protein